MQIARSSADIRTRGARPFEAQNGLAGGRDELFGFSLHVSRQCIDVNADLILLALNNV
jgi:hypothetical protein